ncbi:MAG: DNA polymerase IV, partial [Candidatus Eisenbacteria bacterium]|nr:DNA polymerase IV [Candidatus Eisenbacteria bacterium]
MTGSAPQRPGDRTILHIDMDAYFAEVEILCNPLLRGKPLIIGGRPGDRGVVATASYEARAFGIRAGMSLTKAEHLCPNAIFLPTDAVKYQSFSIRILKYLLEITPRVEMWSIDEAFLDLSNVIEPRADRFMMPMPSGNGGLSSRPVRETPLFRMASRIRDGIAKEIRLPCSIGGGPNKLVAKMATGLHKPRGLTLLGPRAFRRHFWPRPVEDLMGVGEKTGLFLRRLGFQTIGDLAGADPRPLSHLMGVMAFSIVAGARGEEGSAVVP